MLSSNSSLLCSHPSPVARKRPTNHTPSASSLLGEWTSFLRLTFRTHGDEHVHGVGAARLLGQWERSGLAAAFGERAGVSTQTLYGWRALSRAMCCASAADDHLLRSVHKIEPRLYMRGILDRIATATRAGLDGLLADRWKLDHHEAHLPLGR